MSRTISYLAAISIMFFGVASSYAEGEQCPTHNRHHGQSSHHDAVLKSMDANSDGTISKSEFDNYHARQHASHFSQMDTDKDGQLTREEFVDAMTGPHGDGCTHADGKCHHAGGQCMHGERKPKSL